MGLDADSQKEKGKRLRSLSILIVLSALGGSTSILIGYAGNVVSSLSMLPFVAPQLLSGLHVVWLILAGVLVRTRGSATFVGAVKGLVETLLSSHLGPFSFVISLTEGLAADLAFAVLKKNRALSVYLAGGFSAASNLIIIQLFLAPGYPLTIYVLAYSASFASGLLLSGYLTTRITKALPKNLLLPNQ